MAMTRAEFDEKWHPVDVGLWAFYSADLDALLVAERERCARIADSYVDRILALYDGQFPWVFVIPFGTSQKDRDVAAAQYIATHIALAIRGAKEANP